MLVETKNLSKVYGDKVAVNDLNIQIERGSFTAILGPNGAGKSTTIQMLIGLLRPTSGQICYAEKLRLGVVFQNSVLDARLTVQGDAGRSNRALGLSAGLVSLCQTALWNTVRWSKASGGHCASPAQQSRPAFSR